MKIIDLSRIKSSRRLTMAVDYAVASCRYSGESLVKFVARSRFASENIQRTLRAWKTKNRVNFIIPGEKYALDNMETQYLLNLHPEEAGDEDIGAANALITVTFIYS
jgi:hypothetical protein